MSWSGPNTVLERRHKVNYFIDKKRKPKLYQANLLKQYHRRATVNQGSIPDEFCTSNGQPDSLEVHFSNTQKCVEYDEDMSVTPDGRVDTETTLNFAEVNNNVTPAQKCDLQCVLSEYEDVLTEVPGCMQSIKHDIEFCSTERIKAKLYPASLHLKPFFEQKMEELLAQGIIRPSMSPHCSPILMVKKSSGSYRLAVDFTMQKSI